MINDGYWKRELLRARLRISFYSKLPLHLSYIEHIISREILFSALIIRKIIEEEAEVQKFTQKDRYKPCLDVLNTSIPVIQYKFVGDKDWIIRNSCTAADYASNKYKEEIINIKDICNWMIHSYVWSIVYGTKRIAGFLVASDFDKEKLVSFVSLSDWIDCLDFCVQKSNI